VASRGGRGHDICTSNHVRIHHFEFPKSIGSELSVVVVVVVVVVVGIIVTST